MDFSNHGQLTDGGDYFLLGYDSEAIVCWTTGPRRGVAFGALNFDDVPSKERINAHQTRLVEEDDCDYYQ